MGWPILLFVHFLISIVTTNVSLRMGLTSKQDSRVVQESLPSAVNLLRGQSGRLKEIQTLQAAIGSSLSNVRLRHYGSI